MNVIIRLQNLPWSANATDIRQFFRTLSIPEGGVHIVGGEQGDAFIAFSADEDARQAMMMSGGRIKGTQVSLHLSSRAEMQKVIEQARNQVNQAFMLQQPPVKAMPTPAPRPSPMIANQYAKRNLEINNPVLSTPNPLANFFAQKQQLDLAQKQKLLQQQQQQQNSSFYPGAQRRDESRDPRDPRNQRRSRSPIDSDSSGYRKVKKSRFSAADDKVEIPGANLNAALQIQQNLNRNHQQYQQQQKQSQQQVNSNSVWDQPPPFQNFNNGMSSMNSQLPARNNYQTENNHSDSGAISDIGLCVKVTNVSKDTNYEDLRKFFTQLNINDIKFLSDNRGNRSGVALIRFDSSDAKKKALTRNMWQLNSTQVMIMSITEEDFETGLASSQRQRRNDDRYRERSDSRERDFGRSNNRYNDNHQRGGGNNYNNYNNQRDNRNSNRSNNRDDDERNDRNDFPPDEEFKILMIDDIPRTATESDICEAFPNIVSITIDRYTAYAKFKSHEIAKLLLENRFIHMIKNKRVFIEASSEAFFNDLVRKFGKYDNPEFAVDADVFNNDQSNDSNNSSQKRGYESRDPRQRNNNYNSNSSNDRDGGGFNNMSRSDCVIMRGLDHNTKIDDVENFFHDLRIYKMRVHILLDKSGNPSGDCFVEFQYPNDANKACNKNNSYLNNRKVTVMMIPREQVEAVLNSFTPGNGQQPNNNNNNNKNRGNDDGGRQNHRQNQWAPPPDFGSPGCVVMLSNLNYRTSIDQICDFFTGYGLRPDQVIRRFNDNGQPTGNACINFNSQDEAESAIEKNNNTELMERSVRMRLL